MSLDPRGMPSLQVNNATAYIREIFNFFKVNYLSILLPELVRFL